MKKLILVTVRKLSLVYAIAVYNKYYILVVYCLIFYHFAKLEKCHAGCGGIITLETGKEKVITIQAYQQGRECTWLFKVYLNQMSLKSIVNK